MTIRPATEGDYPAAVHLFRILMGEPFDLDQALYEELCRRNDHLALVAEEETGGVAGLLIAVVTDRIRPSANSKRRRIHIDQLIVDPERRRRGVGRALLEHVVGMARDQAPSYIIVSCDFTNVAARKTYESAGFGLVRQNQDRFEIAFP